MLVSTPAAPSSDALVNIRGGGGSSAKEEPASVIVTKPRPPCRLSLSTPLAAVSALPSPLSPISANPCVAMATTPTTAARKRRACMGGFLSFSAGYPQHCESKTNNDPESGEKPASEPSGVSQGPTRVLNFLYVGSQADALDEEVIRRNGITHILNVSSSCPQSRHVPQDNFLRISVNDGYVDRLLPHFQQAFHFLENVRETSGRCLVHCLAGISRSPTLSIAYIMKHKKLSHEDAYRFVKEKRTNISPNFNFLGQLLEFEKQLKRSESFSAETAASPSGGGGGGNDDTGDCWEAKRQRTTVASSHSQPAGFLRPPPPPPLAASAQSPTTALSRLSFTPCSSATAAAPHHHHHLPEFPGTSLEQVAVTPCRSAVAATCSAPPTPPPPFMSAAVADSGRSRSLENLADACAASGGSMKSLSSSASNGSHGSQEILTYS